MCARVSAKRYHGPPGDDRIYSLPRDRDDLDTAWDRYYDEHPDKDPSHAHVHTWLCRDCGMEREPLYGPDF